MSNKERVVLSFILSMASIIFPVMAIVIVNNDRYVHVEPFFTPDMELIETEREVLVDPSELFVNQSDEDVKNLVRNQDDDRPVSHDDYTQNQPTGDPYERIKAYEQQLFSEAGGEKERTTIKNDMDQRKHHTSNSGNGNKTPGKTESSSSNQYSGDVMVEFKLEGRTAFENNLWYVRNPGYTCGYGSSGKVVVSIKVDKGGRVIDARYDATKSNGANECMIEQSVRYAKKSRFNFKDSSPTQQTGFIIYKFIAQ
ncbi:MAG: hypothetical protein ACKO4Y_06710 [Flavobacteriales bacterium]